MSSTRSRKCESLSTRIFRLSITRPGHSKLNHEIESGSRRERRVTQFQSCCSFPVLHSVRAHFLQVPEKLETMEDHMIISLRILPHLPKTKKLKRRGCRNRKWTDRMIQVRRRIVPSAHPAMTTMSHPRNPQKSTITHANQWNRREWNSGLARRADPSNHGNQSL